MDHPNAAGADPRAALQRPTLQRRTLRVLVAAQILAGLGQSAAAAGALLALDVTGSEALAGLPLAFLVLGSAASVVPISARSRRAGRRAGLTLALLVAACGAAGVVVAGALESFPLLLAAHAAFGAGNAAVMLARYAAADLSAPAVRGRAIGTVVFATTFGAVLGPNLLTPAGTVAGAVGLPALTGLYLVAAGALLVAAGVLLAFLRPDPLLTAVRLQPPTATGAPARPDEAASHAPGLVALLATPAAIAGLATMVVANFVMVAVMTMAPVHLHREGHGLTAVGLVVSLHVAGMFAPAPLTGALTDRLGPLPVAGAGACLLVVAGAIAAAAGGDAVALAAGLALLGVGWNAALVAGSTLLTAAVPLAQRPRAESAGELGMGVTAGTATAVAGPVMGLGGYATLALVGAGAAATLGPLLVGLARREVPRPAAPAPRIVA